MRCWSLRPGGPGIVYRILSHYGNKEYGKNMKQMRRAGRRQAAAAYIQGGMKMNKAMKYVLLALALLYVVSPVDFMPGPVDDVIMLAATMILNNRNAFLNSNKTIDEKNVIDEA